ncbi:hypothetical protein Plhal703r1_c08g0042611 [Plasmopara halstedii]
MARVLSCRFLRLSCSEDDHPLFRHQYARCNRQRGIKLLRCFPHCCPEHMPRSYCGTSVHVEVMFKENLPTVTQNSILVCARFEPSRIDPNWPINRSNTSLEIDTQEDERKLEPGEIVPLPVSLLTTECSKLYQTVWIRADKEGDTKQRAFPENSVLYVLNNHRFPKWQYSYDSSITRRQREMTHHLAVYVFQLTDSTFESEVIEALVLARHESPGFYLVSYRRSGNAGQDIRCHPNTLQSTSIPKYATLKVEASEMNRKDGTPSRISIHSTTNINNKLVTRKLNRSPASAMNFIPATEDSNANFWARDIHVHQSRVAEKASHLLILWRFLNFVNLSDVGMPSSVIKQHVQTDWLRAAKALQASADGQSSRMEEIVRSFLSNLSKKMQTLLINQNTIREQAVIQATGQLFLRAISSRAVRCALKSAFTTEFRGMEERQVRKRFIVLVLDLYDILGDLFQMNSSYVASAFPKYNFSLPVLVDEVLTLIYSHKQFAQLKSEVTGFLTAEVLPHTKQKAIERLFGCFITQFEECITAVGYANKMPELAFQRTDGRSARYSAWNRTWLLAPESIQILNIMDGHEISSELSLVDFSRWIYELSCIKVTTNGVQLIVRSVLPIINGMAATELVLDGHLQHLRLTPGGISIKLPILKEWWVRDYAGRFADQFSTLKVDFYAFKKSISEQSIDDQTRSTGKKENSTTVFRVSLTLILQEHVVDGHPPTWRIVIRGIVAQANCADNLLFETANISNAVRFVILQQLPWVADLDLRGVYLAAPS